METAQRRCITAAAATAARLLDIPCHSGADRPLDPVLEEASRQFQGRTCDRMFFYNPDAIAQWIFEKYRPRFAGLEARAPLRLELRSVMPSVTPVCFASMYSGLTPDQHGIQAYVKPVLTVDTLFDDAARAGRRAAIISTEGDSISKIFLDRPIDYFIYPSKEACNAKALDLISRDEHDLIVLYNGDFDHNMHYHGPEGRRTLRALDENLATFCTLHDAIQSAWGGHDCTLAFAPDHGCHKVLGVFGNHGLDQPSDMELCHFYSFLPRHG